MKDKTILEDPIFPELISAYQNSLKLRYSKESLEKYPKYKTLPRELVDGLVDFFIEFLYPEFENRKKLDSAFNSLAGFMHQPAKLWGILGNLAASIFRFGRHFPQALKAGVAALHSYVTAHNFEEVLLRETKREFGSGDFLYSEEGFKKILGRIPANDADRFRKDIGKLLSIFTDEVLVNKIILIMEDVLARMEKKHHIYSEEDRKGIELGIRILERGKGLFEKLKKEEMLEIIQAIDEIERDYFIEAKRTAETFENS
ncbi:hypothetical protein [Leptospira sp. 'Mane']|uniref:hypothetical protein n=1 Tax=Leptospira sp. 'Mane' TaxID=3387407 RepID=UPI00398A94B9